MINKLKNAINKSKKIVFFTGAGMSTASGIPDFRSATGLYRNVYRAEEMLSHSFFVRDPKLFYEFYKDKMIYPDALPNYAHSFMANLEKDKEVTVITQNIDGLHQLAGSKNVIELHGTVLKNHCTKCHKFYTLADIMNKPGIPYCECGGIIKPDVVLYEESLNENDINRAIQAIYEADLLAVCGTSLVVYPAASFVRYFKGETLAIINRDPTSFDSNCDIVIYDDLVKTFKQLDM